ncbi:MAG TPA: ROK family protein [Terracidiphilus sp.]|nr:ROK family protein [Terracidiphilus sp.]
MPSAGRTIPANGNLSLHSRRRSRRPRRPHRPHPRRFAQPHPPCHAGHRHWRFWAQGHAARCRRQLRQPAPAHRHPATPTPEVVLAALDEFRTPFPDFDRVSVGFPGIVKRGVTILSVNLHPDWCNFPLQDKLAERWSKPVRVGNDADIAGYGAIQGQGVELVLTFGTGLGSALFTNGHLVPGLELSLHPWRKKGMNYEDSLGRRGLDKYGKARWNEFLESAIKQTEMLFNWDHLYLGGGNTKKITFKLPKNVTIVSNESGLLGGVFLWKDQG